MGKYGDIEMSINPGAERWNEVKVEDEKWKSGHDEFNRKTDMARQIWM